MILHKSISLSGEEIEEGLMATRSVLDLQWLERQHRLRPSDFLLLHLAPVTSPKFNISVIRQGFPTKEMHPIAEAVLVGQEIVKQYKKDGRLCGSNLVYLLMSIRDIVAEKDNLQNLEERLIRLQSSDWKSTLYELLIAVAYFKVGTKVQVIPEEVSPTPDIELSLDTVTYVECKAKLQYEAEILKFISKWRRETLGDIAAFLKNVNAGFLVKIQVKNKNVISKIPKVIEQMVTNGETERIISEGQISIVPFASNETIPPRQMSFYSEDFWDWAVGFNEWKDWHYILPGGNVQFTNRSNAVVKKLKRPILICIRAEYLRDNTTTVR